MDIDLPIGPDQDAIGIDQENLAIGSQGAKQLRRIRGGDPIQGRGVGRRLDKLGQLTGGNREIVPTNDDSRCGLVDGEGARNGTIESGDPASWGDYAIQRIGLGQAREQRQNGEQSTSV